MDNKETGSWKNNVCFVADDGSNADGYMIQHAQQADDLGEYINTSHPEFMVNKIYFDSYKKGLFRRFKYLSRCKDESSETA